jgi:hypothetical protein
MGCLRGEEKRDTYKNIIKDMNFVSEEHAFEFYNKYAKQQGFSIRRERVKWLTTKSGKKLSNTGGSVVPRLGNVKRGGLPWKSTNAGHDLCLVATANPTSVCRIRGKGALGCSKI